MPAKSRPPAKARAVPTRRPRSSEPPAKRTRAAQSTAAKPATRARTSAGDEAPAPMLLRLYIAGTSDRSTQAIQNARRMCEAHLAGRYELEVIDLFQQPALAKDHKILAVPTLIRALPIPLRRFIGDLSDQDVVLIGLDLKAK